MTFSEWLLMSNLYVAATIKKIALAENIDLMKELDSYRMILKKLSSRYRDLDNVIETELNEKISHTFARQQEKDKKDK